MAEEGENQVAVSLDDNCQAEIDIGMFMKQVN